MRFLNLSSSNRRDNVQPVHFVNSSIVAVHGLDGDAITSWTSGESDASVCWLQHPSFLPQAFPDARILTYGYDAKTFADRTSSATLREHGEDLLQAVAVVREESNVRVSPSSDRSSDDT